MPNACILIQIQSVFVAPKSWSLYPTWANELNIFISGIVEQNDYKMIAIRESPDPTHLVVGLKPEQSINSHSSDGIDFSVNRIKNQEYAEGCFNWQAGYGFSHTFSKIGPESNKDKAYNYHYYPNYLINKYLEFLTKFNSAYDDDLFLNLSYCISLS